jgi:hypothetical protein
MGGGGSASLAQSYKVFCFFRSQKKLFLASFLPLVYLAP